LFANQVFIRIFIKIQSRGNRKEQVVVVIIPA